MRIASYNIMRGGFEGYDASFTIPQRLPLLQKAIKKINADIIGLVDTYRWDEIYTDDDLKKLFGYKYAYCINLNDDRLKQLGHNNGLTLLSNIEVQPTIIRLKTRNAIFAQVKNKNTPINLVLAYLDDISEDARLEQIEVLHSLVDSPVIIMGDLNTLNDGELVNAKEQFNKFTKQNPETGTKLTPVVNDMLRGDVFKKLKSWGLEDAGQGKRLPTMPTPLFPANVDGPFLRIDYCLHSPSISISNFKVHYDGIFKEASDHFPISFTVT